jgi:hypothetical protein
MNQAEGRRSPVYRQLEAYGESWKLDHDQAMACRDWEDAIAVGINIFHMLRDREQVWRDQVFRGVIPYSEDDNLDHQARFANWLRTTKQFLTENLPHLEKRFGTVEGSAKLHEYAGSVDQLISDWKPPQLSMAIGLREMTLTAEAAAELDRLLAKAKSLPREMPSGPRLEEISAAEYLRRKRQAQS